jgi:hypothetical protein
MGMVSKPMDSPRGETPKPREEGNTRRQRGRPEGSVKLLANDPWRYLYALTQTAIENSRALKGPSTLRICQTFAAFKAGRPTKVGEGVIGDDGPTIVTESFHDRWQRGLPFAVVHCQWDGMPDHTRAFFKDHKAGDHWWDKDKFRPTAENMRTNLRLWRKAPATNPNRQWLAGMVKAMRICFSGLDEYAGQAESFAAEIGETRYFAAKLRPIIVKYADLRRAGVDSPNLPLLSQMLDLIDPDYAPQTNYLPNDSP